MMIMIIPDNDKDVTMHIGRDDENYDSGGEELDEDDDNSFTKHRNPSRFICTFFPVD